MAGRVSAFENRSKRLRGASSGHQSARRVARRSAVVLAEDQEAGMQHRLTIDYGDDVLFSSGLTRGAFDEEARFLLAAKLYEVGRLRSGLAAKLCGKGRVDFLLALPRIGIAMSNLQPEDLDSDVEFIRRG
jgi:predicted HTH domain antitoxin